jgi:hypothetical protein
MAGNMQILLIGNERGGVGNLANAIGDDQLHIKAVASEAEALSVLTSTEPSPSYSRLTRRSPRS